MAERTKWRSLRRPAGALSAILVLCMALSGLSSAKGKLEGKVMVILDSSASMAGAVGSGSTYKTKHEAAAIAFNELINGLGRSKVEVDIGLMAYGHRRRGRCDDIEELISPSSSKDSTHRRALRRAVKSLQVRGKTPLTASLEMAADRIGYKEERAIVVLITDGIETCNRNPCEAAARLEESGVDFTAHVVGFDISQEEMQQLRCVADLTGGLFLLAQDTEQLVARLEEIARQIVSASARIRLESHLIEPSLSFNRPRIPVELELSRVEPDREVPVGQPAEDSMETSVSPGRYVARARYGGLVREQTFDLADEDHKRVTFSFGPARLRGRALNQRNEPLPDDEVKWTIQTLGGGAAPLDRKVLHGNRIEVTLAPGRYRVSLEYRGRRAKTELDLRSEKVEILSVRLTEMF